MPWLFFLTFNLANKRRIIRVYDGMNKKDAYMQEIALWGAFSLILKYKVV